MRSKILCKIWVIQTVRGIKNWIRVVFHPVTGKLTRTSTETQQCFLKSGNKMTLNLPAPGNWSGEMKLQAQLAPGNWSEVKISNSEGQSYTSTTCKSPTIDTSRQVVKNLRKVEIAEEAPIVGVESLKTNVASALNCMLSLLFHLFRIPRLEALMLWNTG